MAKLGSLAPLSEEACQGAMVLDVLFLNGTVGAGKTTVAYALSTLLAGQGTRHAVIDLDEIRRLIPPPNGDPFQQEVELRNLRSLARNFRDAGATRLVLAGVLEEPRARTRYLAALGTTRLVVCRLTVDPQTARDRLTARHADDDSGLRWHLARTTELAAILEAAGVDDLVVDTTGRTPTEVALEVQRAAGW